MNQLPAPYSIVCAYDIGASGGFVINKKTGQSDLFVSRYDLDAFIEWCRVFEVSAIYAENVHAFGGQGAVSTGSLMEKKGELKGIGKCLDIPIHWVEPLKWIECFTLKRKKHFKTKTLWKRHLESVAKEQAPDFLVNEITLQTADAFLLWIYGARMSSGTPMFPKGFLFK